MRFDFWFSSKLEWYCFLYGSLNDYCLNTIYIRFPVVWLFTYCMHTWSFDAVTQQQRRWRRRRRRRLHQQQWMCSTIDKFEHLSVLSIFAQRRFHFKWKTLHFATHITFRRLQTNGKNQRDVIECHKITFSHISDDFRYIYVIFVCQTPPPTPLHSNRFPRFAISSTDSIYEPYDVGNNKKTWLPYRFFLSAFIHWFAFLLFHNFAQHTYIYIYIYMPCSIL